MVCHVPWKVLLPLLSSPVLIYSPLSATSSATPSTPALQATIYQKPPVTSWPMKGLKSTKDPHGSFLGSLLNHIVIYYKWILCSQCTNCTYNAQIYKHKNILCRNTHLHSCTSTYTFTHMCIPIPVMAFLVIIVICQKHTLIYGQIKNTPEKKLQVLVTLATEGD